MFDRSSPECVGGHDPAHYNQNANSPHFHTQTRDTCDWVSQCAARMQANYQPPIVPVSQLTRPNTPSPWATKFTQPSQPVVQPWRPPTPTAQQQPGQLMSVNFGIPQYLTVREPQTQGVGFFARLGRESLRSALKSIGHTFAHFFDVEIFGPPPNDGGNPQGG